MGIHMLSSIRGGNVQMSEETLKEAGMALRCLKTVYIDERTKRRTIDNRIFWLV